jgi:hypothetical protein
MFRILIHFILPIVSALTLDIHYLAYPVGIRFAKKHLPEAVKWI